MQAQSSNRTALAFIFIVALLDILGLTLLIPVTPFIVREFRSDATTVALLTVAYSVAQFIAAPWLGRLSDRLGRKPVLIVCLLGSAIGYLLFGIGGALWVLLLSRIIDGITGGNISVAMAYIADITQPQDRARNFALIGAAFGLGFVLGPALSGLLLPFGYAASAFAAGALSLSSAIVGLLVLPESLPKSLRNLAPIKLGDANPFGATFELFRRPVLGSLLTANLIFSFAFAAFVSNIVVYLMNRYQADAGIMAMMLVITGVVRVVMFPLVGKFVARFGEKPLALFGISLQALTFLLLPFAPELWMFVPLLIVNGIGSGFVFATVGAMASNQLQLNEQGKLAGVNTALQGLGNIAGPIWAGLAYDTISPVAPYVSAGLLLLAALSVLAQTHIKRVQPLHASMPEQVRIGE